MNLGLFSRSYSTFCGIVALAKPIFASISFAGAALTPSLVAPPAYAQVATLDGEIFETRSFAVPPAPASI